MPWGFLLLLVSICFRSAQLPLSTHPPRPSCFLLSLPPFPCGVYVLCVYTLTYLRYYGTIALRFPFA